MIDEWNIDKCNFEILFSVEVVFCVLISSGCNRCADFIKTNQIVSFPTALQNPLMFRVVCWKLDKKDTIK